MKVGDKVEIIEHAFLSFGQVGVIRAIIKEDRLPIKVCLYNKAPYIAFSKDELKPVK